MSRLKNSITVTILVICYLLHSKLFADVILTEDYLCCKNDSCIVSQNDIDEVKKLTSSWHVSPTMSHKSILNFGQLTEQTSQKILNNHCLHIVNLGGSISCGHFTSNQARGHDDLPQGIHHAYPSQLEKLLQRQYTCIDTNGNRSNHIISNYCRGGTPSESWVDIILQSMHWNETGVETVDNNEANLLKDILFDADLVMMETTLNDIEHGINGVEALQKATEFLIHIIWSLPKHPSPMWIGASAQVTAIDSEDIVNRPGDSCHLQRPVLMYYDVPQLCVFDSIAPLMSKEAKNWWRWWFLADNVHPTITGHNIVAHLIYKFLNAHVTTIRLPFFTDFDNSQRVVKRKPLHFNSIEEINYLIQGQKIILIDLTSESSIIKYVSLADSASKWKLYADVTNKPGFIGHSIGDNFQIKLTKQDFNNVPAVTNLTLHVNSLKSYEHMGVVQIKVTKSTGLEKIFTLDCLWENHVSEQSTAIFPLNFNDASITTPESIALDITIISSQPLRAENKVKLISISLFYMVP